MSARGPGAFYVNLDGGRALVLRGELDIGTIQDLQDKIDEVVVPGVAIVLDGSQGRPSERNTCSSPHPGVGRRQGGARSLGVRRSLTVPCFDLGCDALSRSRDPGYTHVGSTRA
jgi:hypothetical protein